MTGIDLSVISAHHGEQVFAFWADGRCSHCASITPEAFVAQLKEGQTQGSWEWVGDTPLYVATASGRFYAEHLLDTGEGWLRWWQAEIALATGVVFWWEGEHLRWRTFVGHGVVPRGTSLLPGVVDRIMAFLDDLDRVLDGIGCGGLD